MTIQSFNELSLEEDRGLARRDSSLSSSRLSFRRQMASRGREEPSVRVSLYKVQHGTLKNGCPASIIETDFQFASTGRSRIETAAINYTFRQRPTLVVAEAKPGSTYDDSRDNRPRPLVVLDITPYGYASIQSSQKVATASLSTMAPGAGVPIKGEASAEYTTSNKYVVGGNSVSAEQPTVAGTVRSRYRGKDTARWMLTEDEGEERGVPNYLRTAVLVERDKDAEFEAKIEVSITLAGSSKARKAFSSTSHNAIPFSPGGNRASHGSGIEIFDLKDLDGKPWENAVSDSQDASGGGEEDSRRPISISMDAESSSEGFLW